MTSAAYSVRIEYYPYQLTPTSITPIAPASLPTPLYASFALSNTDPSMRLFL